VDHSSNIRRDQAGRRFFSSHLGPLLLFAGLSVMWTWPLLPHLRTAVPGEPGDNYSFLWNVWWMRHVLTTPDAAYFRTQYLFYPLGIDLANHSHWALPAFVGATALRGLTIVTALNVIVLATVCLNMGAMYALTWSVTRHRRAAILSGIVFGLSPYLALRLLGHFELLSAWVIPLFALSASRAFDQGSTRASVAAGLVLTITAYVAYYYVVFLALFTAAWLVQATHSVSVVVERRGPTGATRSIRVVAATLLVVAVAMALAVTLTGGTVLHFGSATVSVRTPQNLLSVAWLAGLALALSTWRPSFRGHHIELATRQRLGKATAIVVMIFLLGASPLLLHTASLMRTGTYATTTAFWRSAPRGIDLIAPLLGPPRHPVTGPITRRAYLARRLDVMEAVGWIGIVPVVLLWWPRRRLTTAHERRQWITVAVVFGVWAAGPFLTIGGVDTGLKLPGLLLQFVPIVSNAHMPGRAIVGVYLALAMLVGFRVARATGRWQRADLQWLMIAAAIVEFAGSPIPVTTLEVPAVYWQLAHEPAGAVCEVPFGVGDGLGIHNVGSQDHAVLYYATVHAHPLVGGYVSRMPLEAVPTYEGAPVTSTLLRLSGSGQQEPSPSADGPLVTGSPCTYVVLDRARASSALVTYVQSLPARLLASADGRDLFRLDAVARSGPGGASATEAPHTGTR